MVREAAADEEKASAERVFSLEMPLPPLRNAMPLPTWALPAGAPTPEAGPLLPELGAARRERTRAVVPLSGEFRWCSGSPEGGLDVLPPKPKLKQRQQAAMATRAEIAKIATIATIAKIASATRGGGNMRFVAQTREVQTRRTLIAALHTAKAAATSTATQFHQKEN